MRDGHEDVHGAGNGQSNAFRALQGQRFGNKFAEDDERIGNGDESETGRNSMGINPGIGNVAYPRNDDRGQCSLPHPAESETGQGEGTLAAIIIPWLSNIPYARIYAHGISA